MIREAAARRRTAGFVLLVAAFVAAACGKKGDPQPPLPRGPNAVSDLSAEQEGDDAVLTFRFPDRLLTGAPLTDLETIEVYRVVRPPSSLTTPRPAGASQGSGPSSTSIVVLPGAAERRAATNTRLAEEAFYQLAEKIATLPLSEIAEHTQGASVVYKDPLSPLFEKEKKPEPLAYAVIAVRRGGSRSPLSNIAVLVPDVAPESPVLFPALPLEGRVCLDWLPPQNDVLGRPVEIGGYDVYRRILPEQEYDRPLNGKPIVAASYEDVGAPYGAPLVYTVRAVLAKNPKVEGLPAEELAFMYRDIYPPAAPSRIDALSEGNRVRLVWNPVDAPDLAGYLVFRAEASGAFERLTRDPVADPFFTDEKVGQGKRYRYAVRAIDRAGNQSPLSPETVAEPF